MLSSKTNWSKTEVVAKKAMLVAKHPLAAEAGLRILQKGGNAIDAAVATAFSTCVVEPYMCGIGGYATILIYLAGSDEAIVIDGRGKVPHRATDDMFELFRGRTQNEEFGSTFSDQMGWPPIKDHANVVGVKSLAIPGTVAALCKALELYGTVSLKETLQPAVQQAREGFQVTWQQSLIFSLNARTILKFPECARAFMKNNLTPAAGDLLVQKDLAKSLERIAIGGPVAFYAGRIAKIIAEECRVKEGLINEEDLAGYEANTYKVTRSKYRDFEILPTLSMPSYSMGGASLVEALNILEGFDLRSRDRFAANTLHLIIEALEISVRDQLQYLGFEESMRLGLKRLTSKEYASKLRGQISTHKADKVTVVPPWSERGSTTALVAIDEGRNMASVTHSLGGLFGSLIVVPKTGILMNDCMAACNPLPGYPSSIKPGGKIWLAHSPTGVLENGRPFAILGTPGARRQPRQIAQVLLNLLDYGMGMQAAMESPRLDFRPDGTVLIDSRIPDEVGRELNRIGHRILRTEETPASYNFGSPVGILVDQGTGKLRSGTDPLRPDLALGYN